jgi:hypothetical protein
MGLERERHFALVDGLRIQPKARLQSLRSGTQSDPTISIDHNCDHDDYFELPCEGERDAQSLRR